jgi:flagellar biogenesis protein FliO
MGDRMEIFGGFMVMMSILSFFMAVVWLVMPFVVFTIKEKLDKTLDVLENIEKRLVGMEAKLESLQTKQPPCEATASDKVTILSKREEDLGNTSLPLV